MKTRRILAASLTLASLLSPRPAAAHGPVEIRARVTYYTASEPGGRRTSTGRRPHEGITCAVDPRLIPYGSTLTIPGLAGLVGTGTFRAEDTGSAVKSRKAALAWGRNVPVVDVYLSSGARVREVTRLLGKDGHFQRVIVSEPIASKRLDGGKVIASKRLRRG